MGESRRKMSPIRTHGEWQGSLLEVFLSESSQLINLLLEKLRELAEATALSEKKRSRDKIDTLLAQAIHVVRNLNGLAEMLELEAMRLLSNLIKRVLEGAKSEGCGLGKKEMTLLFQACEGLEELVKYLRNPKKEPPDTESIVSAMVEITRSESPVSKGKQEPAFANSLGARETVLSEDPFDGIEDDLQFAEKYTSIFLDEANLALDEISEALLKLEGGGTSRELTKMMAQAHRIKGSAASIGFHRVAKMAHLMEDLLQELVDQGRPLSTEVADGLFLASDALRTFLDRLREGKVQTGHFLQAAVDLINARPAPWLADGPEETSASPSTKHDPTTRQGGFVGNDEDWRRCVLERTKKPEKTIVGFIALQSGLALSSMKALVIWEKLKKMGEPIAFDPAIETLEEDLPVEWIRFGLVTEDACDLIRAKLQIGGVRELHVHPLQKVTEKRLEAEPFEKAEEKKKALGSAVGPSQTGNTEGPSESGQKADRPNETLRVDIRRLDHLMNLSGQLAVNKAHFAQINRSWKKSASAKRAVAALGNVDVVLKQITGSQNEDQSDERHAQLELGRLRRQVLRIQKEMEPVRHEFQQMLAAQNSAKSLDTAVHSLGRISDEIQKTVMDTRMISVGPLFHRFKRVVRDLSHSTGKVIRLEISGEKTELDKHMVDELSDPLIHMIRNAVDHGIGNPEERLEAGKPQEGTISLNAFQRGNRVVLEIRDDGRGLDPKRIAQKALEKGLLEEADLERMTDTQIFQLACEPGLSTAEQVSDLSGRGMGMDIAKSKIEELGGTVVLKSSPGQGTRVTVKLPLTMAIMPSLLVEVGGEPFALPVESVVEIVALDQQQRYSVRQREVVEIRNEVVSVVPMSEAFENPVSVSRDEGVEPSILVVLKESQCKLALAVDRVLGKEDVVIRSMAENYQNIPGIAGASILGDGRVSLILDMGRLFKRTGGRATTRPALEPV